MTTAQICIMIVIVVYLAAMVLIGAEFSKRTNNVGDFYLGGRKLGPLVTAMSAEASDMSSWLLMGLPGVAYVTGICNAGWTAIGLAVGTYLNWLIVAKRLRNYSSHCNAITIPEFFSKRYKEKSNLLMAIAAIIIVIFFVPYTASGFAACGKLFGTLFGVDYHIAMIVSAIVIVGYTSLGGFNAASTTDLVQSIVMTIALVVVFVFGINQAGGWDAVILNAQSLKGYLSMFNLHDVTTGGSTPYSAIKIVSTLAWGLGYFGMPHVLLRFMAIEDPKKIKLSRRVAVCEDGSDCNEHRYFGWRSRSWYGIKQGYCTTSGQRNNYHSNCKSPFTKGHILCTCCRLNYFRYSCLHNVNIRQSAACCLIICVREYSWWTFQN